MDVEPDAWWWCLKHSRVEHGPGCPNSDRLGPFETEREATNAIELARERNQNWTDEDRRWNGEPEDPNAPKIF